MRNFSIIFDMIFWLLRKFSRKIAKFSNNFQQILEFLYFAKLSVHWKTNDCKRNSCHLTQASENPKRGSFGQ